MGKLKTAAPASTPRHLKVEPPAGKSRDALIADLATAPCTQAAMVVVEYSKALIGAVDVRETVRALKGHAKDAQSGDLSNAEAMLTSQAVALNTIFAEMARRASLNLGEYVGIAETYMRLALKAQSQGRTTLDTLATLKSPSVVFAKQANITNGPQQVNNTVSRSVAHTAKIKKPQTELLEHDHGQRLDTRAAAATSGRNQAVEAVAEVYRAAQSRRKGHGQP